MENKRNKYPTQRTSGVWLVYIGLIIILATAVGGDLLVQPYVIGIGYALGFFFILALPFVNRRLAYGENTKFQERFDNLAIVLNFVLCTLCGLYIGFSDLRLLWLCLFIAIGVHFVLFYFSQGGWMLVLAALTTANAALGLILTDVPFFIFAVVDGTLKIGVGIKLLSQKNIVFETKSVSA